MAFGQAHLFMNFIKTLGIILIFSFSLFGKKLPIGGVGKSPKALERDYWKTFSKFQKTVCKPSTLSVFDQKLKDYRGEGFYLPIINGKIYPTLFPDTIKELEKKRNWIQESLNKLKKMKSLPPLNKEILDLNWLMKKSLDYQEKVTRFRKKPSKAQRKAYLKDLKKISQIYMKMMNKVFFLKRQSWPVDHFANRLSHDSYYGKKSLKDKKEQKKIFLLRKVLEDGLPGSSHSGSDKFFRTTLETLAISLDKGLTFLDEATRYDLRYVLGILKKIIKMPPAHYIKRFNRWKAQVEGQLEFYKNLYEDSLKGSGRIKKILSEKKRATSELRNFVQNKQWETYLFWSQQSSLMQSLYALETILFNEVGPLDPEGIEKRDVLQVVHNRYEKPYYRRLKKRQGLYRRASSRGISRTAYPWLNILFNRGEFSFTLYYFKASRETFCPSMDAKSLKLREKNLAISIESLEKPRKNFKAERYFSRASMIGHIDMSSIWRSFREIPERVGPVIEGKISQTLTRSLKDGRYQYLYSFSDFHVLMMRGKTRVLRELKNGKGYTWYRYRNPHYFRYFEPKKK